MRSAVMDVVARQLGVDATQLRCRMVSDPGLQTLVDGICALTIDAALGDTVSSLV